MFDNYWLGKGDYNLSDERFKDIAGYAGAQDPPDSRDVIGSNGEHLQQRLYSFYGLPDYNRSLGRSTLFYDQSGRPVGFYDYYNFDPGVNKRDWLSEVETRAMHMLPKPASAKPFKIRYGESPTPN